MPLSSAGSLDSQHQVNTINAQNIYLAIEHIVCVQSNFHLILPMLDVLFIPDSSYERPNRTVHLTNVLCSGNEENINACTKTAIALEVGKTIYRNSPVVAVDCSAESPTEPTCLPKQGLIISALPCSTEGSVRLVDGSTNGEGRLEFCHSRKWSPFCTLDFSAASVACKQLGYSQYTGVENELRTCIFIYTNTQICTHAHISCRSCCHY